MEKIIGRAAIAINLLALAIWLINMVAVRMIVDLVFTHPDNREQ